MMKVLKGITVVLCAGLLLVAGLIAGAHLYLGTEAGTTHLLAFINRLLPGEITARNMDVSLLAQEAVLRNVLLKGPDGQTIIQAERVALKMNLPALVRHALIFTAIEVSRPTIALAIDKDGRLNMVSAFMKKNAAPSTLSVQIGALAGSDCTLVMRLADGKERLRMERLRMSLAAVFSQDTFLRLRATSASLALKAGERSIDCGASTISATLVNDRIEHIRFSTQRNTSRLTISGAVRDLSRKALLELNLTFDADVADLSPALALPPEIVGRLVGKLSAHGIYDNPALSATLDYGGGNIKGLTFGPTRLQGSLSDHIFTCDVLRVPVAAGVVTVKGSVDLRPVFPHGYFGEHVDADAVAYDFAVTGAGLRLAAVPHLPRDLRGVVSTAAAVRGRGFGLKTMAAEAAISARATGLSASRAFRNADLVLKGRVTYRNGTMGLDPLRATALGSVLTTRATVDVASHAIRGTLELQTPQIERFLAPYTVDARGAITGTAVIAGTFDRPEAQIALTGTRCAWKDFSLGDVRLDSQLAPNGTLVVRRCTITSHASTASATGTVQLFRSFPHLDPELRTTLTLDLAGVNPRDFSARLPLEGAFTGSIKADGGRSSLDGEFELQGRRIAYAGVPLGEIKIEARLRDGLLNVASLELACGRSTVKASGTARVLEYGRHLALVADPAIDLRIEQGTLYLEDFADEARGGILLSGAVQGSIRHPQGNLALAGQELNFGLQRLSGLNLAVRLDGERAWIEPFTAEIAPGQIIEAKGWIAPDGAYSMTAASTGIALASLAILSQQPDISGTAVVTLTGTGTLAHPELSGQLTVRDIHYQDNPLPDWRVDLDLHEHRLSYTGALDFALSGDYDFASGAYHTEAVFDRTTLAPYFALAGRSHLAGTATGRLKVGGRRGTIRDIDVRAAFSQLEVSLEGKPVVQANDLTGTYRDGILAIPRQHIRLAEAGGIDVSGSGTLHESLVFDAEGSIPAQVIGSLVEDLEDAVGNIRFSTQVRSRRAHTEVSSLITLEDIGAPLAWNGQRLQEVNGRIRVEDAALTLEGITGRLDTGSFSMGGSALLHDYTTIQEMHIKAQGKALPLEIPNTMDLTVDADLTLAAADGKSHLGADVAVLDGTYYKDVDTNLFSGVFKRILAKPRPKARPVEKVPAFLSDLALDVNIKRRGDVLVENNIAVLNLNPDLKVTGSLALPIMSGRITVTEGTMTFQGKEFKVTRGVIDFLNPTRTEAEVDINGQTTVQDWTITIALTGKLDNLLVELSSSPVEEQEDILSLLVVGKTTRELAENKRGVKISPSAMMAELLANTYGENIKKTASLDILKLESADFTTAQQVENNLKLTLGKELSQRMTIKYEMETRSTGTIQRGIAEYKLLDNLLINGYQGDDGIYGTEIQLRYEFR